MRILKHLLPVFIGLTLLTACSGKSKGREVRTYVSAFLKDNATIVAFGKADLSAILEKADYRNIPKLNVLLTDEVNQFNKSLDMKTPVHFALEGPFDPKGTPATVYAFMDVRNADSLVDKLTSLGLNVEESGDLQVALNGDIAIGVRNDLAILISKKGTYDGKALLAAAFEKTTGDESGGKTDQILQEKADIVIGTSLQNLYATSNTDLSKLNETKQKELQALVADSYLQTAFRFEKGQAVIETENLLSDALQRRMFFGQDNSADILNKLGKGKARLGLAMNLDMEKIESFMDDFAPEFKQQLTKSSFQLQIAMATLGDKPFTNLLSGKLGFVMVGDALKDGSITPEINFHVGLGKKGKSLADLALGFFSMESGAKSADGSFSYSGMDFRINEQEVTGNTKNAGAGVNTLIIPQGGENFGKAGITGFMNLEGLDIRAFGFSDGAKALNAVSYISLTADNKGSRILIKGRNDHENILKQIVNVYIQDIQSQIGAI